MSAEVSATGVAWFRRLSVRLPVLLILTLFLFDLTGGQVRSLVFRAFGLPGPGDPVLIEEWGEAIELDWHSDLTETAERALEGATRTGPGLWVPDAAQFESQVVGLGQGLVGALWTSTDLEVLAATTRHADLVGSAWTPNSTIGFSEGFEELVPIYRAGELAGWMAFVFGFDEVEALGSEAPEGSVELWEVPPEIRRIERKMDLIAGGVAFLLNLLAAVLLGLALSKMVTSRLSRLTQVAELPVGEPDGPSGRGSTGSRKDEITLLSESLHAARSRVAELVEDLEQRDVDRRRWVAQVAHDLRTPLTALKACLERAGSNGAESIPEATSAALATARLDTERLQELVEDLLEAARLEAGLELDRETVLAGELVERAIRGVRPLAEQRGLQLSSTVAFGLPALDADGLRLMRVLENLLRNALRHARQAVSVEALAVDRWVQLCVLDDGLGFAAGESEPPTVRERDSAGLGLAIARTIVEAHGGVLEISNRPEGGGRACVRVPVEPPARS